MRPKDIHDVHEGMAQVGKLKAHLWCGETTLYNYTALPILSRYKHALRVFNHWYSVERSCHSCNTGNVAKALQVIGITTDCLDFSSYDTNYILARYVKNGMCYNYSDKG
jgi:hypothetical protein